MKQDTFPEHDFLSDFYAEKNGNYIRDCLFTPVDPKYLALLFAKFRITITIIYYDFASEAIPHYSRSVAVGNNCIHSYQRAKKR
jgi:hypothetical protein